MEQFEAESTVERMLIARAQQTRSPINGSLELLPLCNMNCDMCYVRLDRASMEAQGRLRTAEEWLAVGEQMQKAGVLFLLLTGGEPLLHPEFREIYLGLRKMGMVLTLNTNGTLIDEEWVEFFREYPPRRINITIYGSDNETYEKLCHFPNGYDRVTRGIRLLTEAGLMVKTAQSPVRKNAAHIDRILDFRMRWNVRVVSIRT